MKQTKRIGIVGFFIASLLIVQLANVEAKTTEESTVSIDISVQENRSSTTEESNVGNWIKTLVEELLTKDSLYQINESFIDIIRFYDIIFSLKNWAQLDLPPREQIIENSLKQLLFYLKTSYNRSVVMIKPIVSFSSNWGIWWLPDLLHVLNYTRNFVNLTDFSKFSFAEIANYSMNTLFVRNINGSIKVDTFGFNEYGAQLPNFVFKAIEYLHYNRFRDQILQKIQEKLIVLSANTSLEDSWIEKTELALAMIEVAKHTNNSTVLELGINILEELYQHEYYKYDDELSSKKLWMARMLIPYNLTFARSIADFCLNIFFDTPLGLQPIIFSNNSNYMKALLSGQQFFGFVNLRHLRTIYNLYQATSNNKYLTAFESIIHFYLANLFYSELDNNWIEGYAEDFTILDPRNWAYMLQIGVTGVMLYLPMLLDLLDITKPIIDNSPPTVECSYFLGHWLNFSSSNGIYKALNISTSNTIKINDSEDYLVLRFGISDEGLGYKTFAVTKNNVKITVAEDITPEHIFSYQKWPSMFTIVKNIAQRTYFIPLNLSAFELKENAQISYNITATDKVGNILKLDITIKSIVTDSLTEQSTTDKAVIEFSILILPMILSGCVTKFAQKNNYLKIRKK